MMSYLRINVNDHDKEIIQTLLERLGYEVSDEDAVKMRKSKSTPDISPTFLFGKWKNIEINPAKFRKQLWQKRNQ